MAEIDITKIITDPLAGKGLAASRDISIGEVIVGTNSPFLIVVEQQSLETVCSYCLAIAGEQDVDFKKCGGCKIPRYCTAACQAADWKLIHRKECKILKRLPAVPPTPVRAAIQLLIRHQHGSEFNPTWADLQSHEDKLKKNTSLWNDILLQAKAAVEYSRSPPEMTGVAIRLLCCMMGNAFRASIMSHNIGLCFDPSLSLVNHSCDPNAMIQFDGRYTLLRALNPIKTGEQIYISYVDIMKHKAERQVILKDRYFFDCKCSKCDKDESPYDTYMRYTTELSPKMNLLYDRKTIAQTCQARLAAMSKQAPSVPWHIVVNIRNGGLDAWDNRARAERIQKLKTLTNYILEQRLYALPPTASMLTENCITYLEMGEYVTSLVLLLFVVFNCDVYNYPQPHHPSRVERLFSISKLLKLVAFASHEKEAFTNETSRKVVADSEAALKGGGADWIDACHAMLILAKEQGAKSHGPQNHLMKVLEIELDEVEEVQRLRGDGGLGMKLQAWQAGDDRGIVEVENLLNVVRGLAGYARWVPTTRTDEPGEWGWDPPILS